MRVLGLSGSLRSDSHNTRLLRAAAAALPPGVELGIYDGLASIPPYNHDQDTQPGSAAVAKLRTAVAHADAVLVATPEYNRSIPGQLKNALDWLSRPFSENPLRNKPVAVIGASSGGFGAVWGQAETRKVMKAIGARVLDAELPIAKADRAFEGNGLADAQLQERLEALLAELVAQVQARNQAPAADEVAA
jgi:chromate reductase